jgi:hypothetical protein
MRKLLGLLMLIPFAAVLVLSCDEHPTAPEEARAATTVQESSAPQAAAKAPTLPTAVVLSGAEIAVWASGLTSYSRATAVADCSEGKWPISGGWRVLGGESSTFVVQTSAPEPSGTDRGAWRVELLRTDGTGEWNLIASAVCVEMKKN